MLHRYEDIVINPLTMDVDIPISKIFLLKQYGFESEELIRDPINFFIKHGNDVPLNIDSVTMNNIVNTYEPFISSALQSRWAEVYKFVPNKIPLVNFANTYYELWALVINRYRMALIQYVNKLNHILLCEGVPYPTIVVQDVFGTPDSDVLVNTNYIILRIYITNGE